MAGTEPREHRLDAACLDGCLALTRAAGWNQNAADWRLMLEIGRGWGLTLADGTLAASTLVLPYGGFAWVSMVLVLPTQRRKGFAARLLRTALADLRAAGLTPVLDATPAGRAVYVGEGFHDSWGFKRYRLGTDVARRGAARTPRGAVVRPLTEADWPQLLARDQKAFGASRERLLRTLAKRLPGAALVFEQDGAMRGYLLGREGHEACQLGPLVVDGDAAAETAQALLDAALGALAAPLYLDAADHAAPLVAWLEARGFSLQRPFTRMVFGAGEAPGDATKVVLVAGPELG